MILGKLKFYLQRLVTYIQALQFLMVGYLFMTKTEMNPAWVLLGVPVGAFVVWFDMKFVVKGEVGEFFKMNPDRKVGE